MKASTAAEIREIDRLSIEEYGIPQSVLMYNAGNRSAEHIINNFKNLKRVLVCCGTGNNGGDGFAAAYVLKNSGIESDILLCGDENKIAETSRIYYNLCIKSEIKIMKASDDFDISIYDLIIEALTGTGFTGTPRGILAETIKMINSSGIGIISLDIPGGMNSDGTGFDHECVHAIATVTMGLPKISLAAYPNRQFCGKIQIADIGFPKNLTQSDKIRTELADAQIFSEYLKAETYRDIHKTENGTLLLIGGFDGMEGSIMLSAAAAFETGIGLALLLTSENSRNIIAGKIPELITAGISDSSIDTEILKSITARKFDGCIIGPGLGRDKRSSEIFRSFMAHLDKSSINKVLIDGDGLYHLSELEEKPVFSRNIDFIITPHFMEASRILGKDISDIRNNRPAYADKLAVKTGSVAVLKGPASITSDGINSIINTTGNSLLAAAGSGDVLSGITGAFMIRDIPTLSSAALAVYIHGRCADLYYKKNLSASMKASDIIGYIRQAVTSLTPVRI